MQSGNAVYIRTMAELNLLRQADEPFILFFESRACGVCHAILPKLQALILGSPIKVVRVDIGEAGELAGQLLVFIVPTVCILHGQRELLRTSRFVDLQGIAELVACLEESGALGRDRETEA